MAEWHTRWSQKPLRAILCGFDSHPRHQKDMKASETIPTTESAKAIGDFITHEFAQLPRTSHTVLFEADAFARIAKAGEGKESWEDALFKSGVSLIHAKVHAGVLVGAEKVGEGFFIGNPYGWDRKHFAEIAIPATTEGYAVAAKTIPAEVLQQTRILYPLWLKHFYGMGYSEECLSLILRPNPIVMPFDHYTKARAFIGDTIQYPASFERVTFSYMKQWEYPATIWYSDRSENDFEGYVREQAKLLGVSVKQFIGEMCCHEGVHVLITNPALDLILSPELSSHCWLGEGIAIYYGEEAGKKSKINSIDVIPPVLVTADNADKSVDYGNSLLLTMAVALRLAGSSNKIDEGMKLIVARLSQRAMEVVEGKSQPITNHSQLLNVISPDLTSENAEIELKPIMEEILANSF